MKKLEAMKKDKDIKAMYKVYKTAFKGKDSFDLYVKTYQSFLELHMTFISLVILEYLKDVEKVLMVMVNGAEQMLSNTGLINVM